MFELFNQTKGPLTSRGGVVVSNKDHVVHLEVFFDVTPLVSDLQLGKVFADESLKELVCNGLHCLPSSADVVGFSGRLAAVVSQQKKMVWGEGRFIARVGTHSRKRAIVQDLLNFAHKRQQLFISEKPVLDQMPKETFDGANQTFPYSSHVGGMRGIEVPLNSFKQKFVLKFLAVN